MENSQYRYSQEKIKGVYVLFIRVERDAVVNIGSLGKVRFNRGSYAYVGSAQNGIEKRIARHLKREKRKFWHIDYLLTQSCVKIEKIAYKEGSKEEECRTAQIFFKFGQPITGFGCSDCPCKSHLFKIRGSFINDEVTYSLFLTVNLAMSHYLKVV